MRQHLFFLTALFIVICDQVSKYVVTQRIALHESIPVLGHFLYLTRMENSGGAFSLLQARNNVFIAIAIVAIFALVYAYRKTSRKDLLVSAAIALALGGAVGNLIDRVRLHYVVDFFDLKWWPVFNVADSAITVGIVLLAWHFLFRRESKPEVEESLDVHQHPTPNTQHPTS